MALNKVFSAIRSLIGVKGRDGSTIASDTNPLPVSPIVGQNNVAAGAGAVGPNTQRTTLASDDPAVTSLGVIDDWDENDRAKVNPVVGQAGVEAGAGVVTAKTQRVAIATDANTVTVSNPTANPETGLAKELKQDTQILAENRIRDAVETMDDWDESDRAKVNPIVGQAGVAAGAGAVTTNTQRVTLTTEQQAILEAVSSYLAVNVVPSAVGVNSFDTSQGSPIPSNASPWLGTYENAEAYVAQAIILKASNAGSTPFAGTIRFSYKRDAATGVVPIQDLPVVVTDAGIFIPVPLANVGPFFKADFVPDAGVPAITAAVMTTLHYRQAPPDLTRFQTQTVGPGEPVKVIRALIEPSSQGDRKILGADRAIFGPAIFSNRANQVQADFSRPLNQNPVTLTTSGGGTTNQADGQANVTTGVATTASSRIQTLGSTTYVPGEEVYAIFTARFTAPTHANSHQRIGIYNDTNGFFIGYNGLTFGFTLRTGGVDTFTPIASANGDPLNGSGFSRFARGTTLESLNPLNLNIYRIRFGWLGSSICLIEVQNPDGIWMTTHTFRFPNLQTTPSIQSPNLPLRMEAIKSAADATSLVIGTGSWAAGTTGAIGLSDFGKLLQRVVSNTDELRLDVEPSNTDYYIGKNIDGVLTSSATWDVARIYLSATKNPTRMRFRQGVVWDNRATGWS